MGANGITIIGESNPNYSYCEDFIPVWPNASILVHAYATSAARGVCFYDSDKNFISATIGALSRKGSIEQVPSTARFVRVCTENWNKTEGLGVRVFSSNNKIYYVNDTSALKPLLIGLMSTYKNGDTNTIYLGNGTFSLDCSDTELEEGIVIMPGTTIIGCGRDKSVLSYDYQGNDDTIMKTHSTLNIKYPCKFVNVGIVARNVRYAVHCEPSVTNEYYWPNTLGIIKMLGVRILHYGFEEGKNPSYRAPHAFGSGITSKAEYIFDDCILESYENGPFFCHNRVECKNGNYKIRFRGCQFVFHGDSPITNLYKKADAVLASYGDGTFDNGDVLFEDCKFSSAVYLFNESGATQLAWNVIADNDAIVLSNAAPDGLVIATGNTRIMKFASAISAGIPVSIDSDINAGKAKGTTDAFWGIVLNNVISGGVGYVAMSGSFIDLARYIGNGFSVGDTLEYNNGWSVGTSSPLVVVVSPGIGRIL